MPESFRIPFEREMDELIGVLYDELEQVRIRVKVRVRVSIWVRVSGEG